MERALALKTAPMAFVKIMIHAVWGTKCREASLTKEIRPQVIRHIFENTASKNIFVDRLNGYSDHLHCLMGLSTDLSIAKAMQIIKGESAYWINKHHVTARKFEWADEYFAVSVSESMLDRTRAYIDRQEQHHRKKTFIDECNEFMAHYNF